MVVGILMSACSGRMLVLDENSFDGRGHDNPAQIGGDQDQGDADNPNGDVDTSGGDGGGDADTCTCGGQCCGADEECVQDVCLPRCDTVRCGSAQVCCPQYTGRPAPVCVYDRYCQDPCPADGKTYDRCGATGELCCSQSDGLTCGASQTCVSACGPTETLCGDDPLLGMPGICCQEGSVCAFGQCLTPQNDCTSFLDCAQGEYCEPVLGKCLADKTPPGLSCQRAVSDVFVPEAEWHWLGIQVSSPPAGEVPPCTSGTSGCYVDPCSDFTSSQCFKNSMSAPMVADLDQVDDPELTWTSPTSGKAITFAAGKHPEVVIKAYAGSTLTSHLIVVLDGRTGETKKVFGSGSQHGQVAIGNLDDDPKLEVVYTTTYGIAAIDPFYDAANGDTNCTWQQSSGSLGLDYTGGAPTLTDLDGDGSAEVVMGGVVVSGRDGAILADFGSANQGGGPVDFGGEHWYIAAVEDVDLDGIPEVLLGNKAIKVAPSLPGRSCSTGSHWADGSCVANSGSETWSWEVLWDASATIGAGFPGVGNFVDNVLELGEIDDPPEVVVVIDGEVAILNGRDGSLMQGPDYDGVVGNERDLFFELFDWRGGAPNIADFDGDGRVEMGFAGRGCMVVLDYDCAVESPAARAALPAGCAVDPTTIAKCDTNLHPNADMGAMIGMLWMDKTQDASSAATGTSVFDFQGDGKAEVLYNDECFFRVYEGESGQVMMERPNSSRTGSEYPVVADVDGDSNSEILFVGNNDQAGANRDHCAGNATDTSLAYRQPQDLYSPSFCNCSNHTSAAECDAAQGCAWAGSSCQVANTSRPDDPAEICQNGTWGVWALGDTQDLWVKTLPYWHQHAYHVVEMSRSGQPQPDWASCFGAPGCNAYGSELACATAGCTWGHNNYQVYNNYRQNVQGYAPLNAPNLKVVAFTADLSSCPPQIVLNARVVNQGRAGIAQDTPICFYRLINNLRAGGPIDNSCTGNELPYPLLPGQGADVQVTYTIGASEPLTDFDFEVVANPDAGQLPANDPGFECDASDNQAFIFDLACVFGG